VNVILRGVRVIDPLAGVDRAPQDVWIEAGRIRALDDRIEAGGVPVIDFTRAGGEPVVLCPGFIDLHVHLRDPGDSGAETTATGARAAAAGGFTHIVAMANTDPPHDSPELLRDAIERSQNAAVRVMHVAAMTHGLDGAALVDVEACIGAGAVALSDDGRNAAPGALLSEALARAGELGRPVLVHPEDEAAISRFNPFGGVTRCSDRPPETEVAAVKAAVKALASTAGGRLHLQHLSAAGSLEPLRLARQRGLTITAEVTPHHLARWAAMSPPEPASLRKVNPPLRSANDRAAMLQALLDGTIDAIATDHAPHRSDEKTNNYDSSAPGMIGLETALAACITLGDLAGRRLPVLVERLTAGPHRVLGEASGVKEPRVRVGEVADIVVFDPDAGWTVSDDTLFSRSRNTPWLGTELRGRVLLTVAHGRVVHSLDARIPVADREPAGV